MASKSSKRVTRYRKNFLSKVILRCDYDSIELGKLEEFSKSQKNKFPFQEEQDVVNREMTIDFAKGEFISSREKGLKTWTFLSATRKKKFIITPLFVAIEYVENSYINRDELIDDFNEVIRPYLEFFNIVTINRLGLRYINEISLNSIKTDFKWENYFNKELLGGMNFTKKTKGELARAMSKTEFQFGSEKIVFQYGIWNRDYPNENTRKEFILDIDCFSRFPHESNDELREAIQSYNQRAEAVFEKSITDAFRDFLKK